MRGKNGGKPPHSEGCGADSAAQGGYLGLVRVGAAAVGGGQAAVG
ncbi:MAG: hypothetical protein ACRD5G_00720 [Candidatus Acidiferrales bacterium]